jgi:hypothetical protein
VSGVAPGWEILETDNDHDVVIEATTARAVQRVGFDQQDSAPVFCCFFLTKEFYTQIDGITVLARDFHLVGWTKTWEGGEDYLNGVPPEYWAPNLEDETWLKNALSV